MYPHNKLNMTFTIVDGFVYVTEVDSNIIFGFVKKSPAICASGDSIEIVRNKLNKYSEEYKNKI